MRHGRLPRPSALIERSDPGFGVRVVVVGVGVTVVLALASGLYTALTWDEPRRAVLAVITIAALCDALVIYLLRARIARSGRLDQIFAGWNVAHVGAAGLAAYADGGAASPYVTILFVSVAFSAVSLPRRYVVAIATLDVAALLAIALVEGTWPSMLVFMVPALVAVAFVCASISGERYLRLLELEEARKETLQRLMRVIEFRDLATGSHVERMSDYAGLIAAQLGWGPVEVERLREAASMHDIGKVAVADSILLKPGPLTEEERREMEQHTVRGARMLTGSRSAELELAAEIALTHHERYDGGGYPHGLAGAAIPLAGRIVAVADVFDALTTDRVYRPAFSVEDALETMRAGRGTQFDPLVLDAFEAVLDEILRARADHGERAERETPTAVIERDALFG